MVDNEILPQTMGDYVELLIDKLFKIIPMKEQNVETLHLYLESFQRELIGSVPFLCIKGNASLYTVISTIQFFIDNDFDTSICKKEVFKCISTLKKLK